MKAKPILLVIGTLIIGFVLGMLTSAQIRLHKLNPVRVFFSEERFRDGFYNTIQPDAQQKAKIELVLDKYAKINSDLQDNFRKNLDLNMKEFRKEIDSNLSKEQIARLKEMDAKRGKIVRMNMHNHPNDSVGNRNNRWHNQNGRPMQDGPPPPPSGNNRDSVTVSGHK